MHGLQAHGIPGNNIHKLFEIAYEAQRPVEAARSSTLIVHTQNISTLIIFFIFNLKINMYYYIIKRGCQMIFFLNVKMFNFLYC